MDIHYLVGVGIPIILFLSSVTTWAIRLHSQVIINRDRERDQRRLFVKLVQSHDRLLTSLNKPDSTFNSRAIQSDLRLEFPFLEGKGDHL